ncbi:hypothetical protein ACB094_10G176500 [Castanea mollissima]
MEEAREGMGQDDVLAFNLYKNTMTGEWGNIVKMYEEQKFSAIYARINSSGDTALHVAVSIAPEEIVQQLIRVITLHSEPSLRLTNNEGNTPLHVAASAGRLNICILLAKVDVFSDLPNLEVHQDPFRNKLGETPLFLAAFHGYKPIFLYLHSLLLEASDKDLNSVNPAYRRNDGETALHCAIRWEYFDVAFEILAKEPNLAYSVNEVGITPLHLLASKPSVFKSGSHLGWWKSIIYHCIHVEELEQEIAHKDLIDSVIKELHESSDKDNITDKFPKNYQTCIQFYQMLQNMAQSGYQAQSKVQKHHFFRSRYAVCFNFFHLLYTIFIRIILGLGYEETRKLKQKHVHSVQIMKMLIKDEGKKALNFPGWWNPGPTFNRGPEDKLPSLSELEADSYTATASKTYQQDGNKRSTNDLEDKHNGKETETAILLAAKNGITEMVEQILEVFPMAILDKSKQRNIALLAAENKQPQVLQLLLKQEFMKHKLIHEVDMKGNNALHLAANLEKQKVWQIPGGALQMQREVKWYEFVKNMVPQHFCYQVNDEGKTPEDVFNETHMDLVKDGGEWLKSISNSCSVVATLIATVVFPASTAVPGGINDNSGMPVLVKHPAFSLFAISSLVALCASVISLFLFLDILTSQYQPKDFHSNVPRKLLLGLTLLFVSIGAMLISFCAGQFFWLESKLQDKAFPVYTVICLPIILLSIGQLPLYFQLLRVTVKKVPPPSYKVVSI